MKLEGMFFDAPAALFAEIEEIVGHQSISECVKVFDEWKDRLERCIDPEGEYLEHNESGLDFLFATKPFYRSPGPNRRPFQDMCSNGNTEFSNLFRIPFPGVIRFRAIVGQMTIRWSCLNISKSDALVRDRNFEFI
jgi:hypothetical protein